MIFGSMIKACKETVSSYGWDLKSSYKNSDGWEMHFYAYDEGVMVVVVEKFILPLTGKPVVKSNIIEFANKNDANNWFKEMQKISNWKKITIEEKVEEETIC